MNYYEKRNHSSRFESGSVSKGGEEIMKGLHMVAYTLLWVGGLNWGLVGLFDYNLVESLLGNWPGVVAIVYILVGLSALYSLFTHKGDCKVCGK